MEHWSVKSIIYVTKTPIRGHQMVNFLTNHKHLIIIWNHHDNTGRRHVLQRSIEEASP